MDNTTQSSGGGSNFSGVAAAILILAVGIFGGIYLGGNATSQKAATGDAIMEGYTKGQTLNGGEVLPGDWPVARSTGWTVNRETKKAVKAYSLISKDDLANIIITDKKTGKKMLNMASVGEYLKNLGGLITFISSTGDGSVYDLTCEPGSDGTPQCWCISPSYDAQSGPDSNYGDMEACMDELFNTA